MANVSPIDLSREAAMTEDLTRFWSTMSKRFEWERSHHKAFNSTRLTSEVTWDDLVAQENNVQPVLPTTPYTKEDSKYGGDVYYSEDSHCDDEYRSGHFEWLSHHQEAEVQKTPQQHHQEKRIVDGKSIGDVPTRYVIQGLQNHELAVVGTYVDPLIVTGFRYIVRPTNAKKSLFQGQALRLVSIGRGYGKRITFASDCLNVNENYFWSDTNPEGYGFAIKLVQEEDKFTLRDANDTPVATAEVDRIMGQQKEVSQCVLEDGSLEKRARVSMLCKVHYFHASHADPKLLIISGVAISVKTSGSRSGAVLREVTKCSIGGERGFTLVPGADTSSIITVVDGGKTGDIPIQYSVTGLQPHEVSVVGTYVDPRILTGFKYRVRPVDSKKHLFGGSSLILQSIGRGYGKRLTFASGVLNHNENYFWSDSNPEGYGFSIQAVSPGDSYRITSSSGEDLGRAQVFRADVPQMEESTNVSADGRVTKRVRVTITCDVSFHGEDDRTLIITGTAVLLRKGRIASVQKVEDIAMNSQINLIFRHDSESLIFLPE